MDKSYLWKRHNVYWVRVRVPDRVRHIIGKSELSKNLHTTDLLKANNLKHGVIAQLKNQILKAEKKRDDFIQQLSKEDQLREFALEFRNQSEESSFDREASFDDSIYNKVLELYGQNETEAIFNSHHEKWVGQEPSPKAIKATADSYKIADPTSQPLSIIIQVFLSERKGDLALSTFKRKECNIKDFLTWFGAMMAKSW